MENPGMQGTYRGATSSTERTSDQTSSGISRFTDSAQQAMDRLSHAASDMAERLSARGEELLESPAADKARTYMREHPLATIGIAVAVGLVLSRLLSRR